MSYHNYTIKIPVVPKKRGGKIKYRDWEIRFPKPRTIKARKPRIRPCGAREGPMKEKRIGAQGWKSSKGWITCKDNRVFPGYPYWCQIAEISDSAGSASAATKHLSMGVGADRDRMYAKFFDRLVKGAEDAAALALTVGESNKSLTMITNRAVQLANIATAILSRNPKRIVNAFGGSTSSPSIVVTKKGQRLDVNHAGQLVLVKSSSKRSAYSVKRGRKRDDDQIVASVSNNPSDVWLETQFGWKPLLEDIHKAASNLAQPKKKDETFPLTAGASCSWRFREGELSSLWHSHGDHTCSVRGRFRVTVVDQEVAQRRQLGIENPALLLWDLIPFSFVADWFLGINKFIDSYSAFKGLKIEGYYTEKRTVTFDERYQEWGTGVNRHSTGLCTTYYRMIGMPSRPKFLDRLHNPFPDLWKTTTSLALAAQQFRKLG